MKKNKALRKLKFQKDVISNLKVTQILGGGLSYVNNPCGNSEIDYCTILVSFGGKECFWSRGVDDFIDNGTASQQC